MGQFYYAAKAFDVLEKLDPNPEYWEGKRGACVGQFQLVVAGRESRLVVHVAVSMLCMGELCMYTRSWVNCVGTQGLG